MGRVNTPTARTWVHEAIARLDAEANRSADTHLHLFPLPAHWGIDLYLKDESTHPSGSLKHRLARSLFLYGLVNGDIGPDTTIVDASSGSTAVSEAYFARLLGLKFVSVVPAATSPEKIDLITAHGGSCHFVDDPAAIYAEAERIAAESDGYYVDQFTNAAIVTDWRGDNTIAGSVFEQLAKERYPEPAWIVVGAGTGGTSATIGRYCRYQRRASRVAVVDPEGAVFYDAWTTGRRDVTAVGSRIEGIGRPRFEPSFVPGVVDAVMRVPDAMSIAAMRLLAESAGIRAGASTGTQLAGAFRLIAHMLATGQRGSVVTLVCDRGDRYATTYYSDEWLRKQGIDVAADLETLHRFLARGNWPAGPHRPLVAGVDGIEASCEPPESEPAGEAVDLSPFRDDIAAGTAACDEVVMHADDPAVLTAAERLAVGLAVALLHDEPDVVARMSGRLLAMADGAALDATVRDQQRRSDLPARLRLMIGHADRVAVTPAHSGRPELEALVAGGLTPRQVVAVSQVISYVSYQCRLVRGANLVKEQR